MEFEGKTVLVTGSGTSLGFATAKAFLECGGRVMINGSTRGRLNTALERLSGFGDRVDAHLADVRDGTQVAGLVNAVLDRFGGLDILVNNAGVNCSTLVEDMPEEEWDRVVDINLKGPFLVCREAIKVFKRQGRGGSVINISSTAGRSARIGAAPYSASKAGLILLTQVLALEWGRYGIRVNAVCPGFISAPDKVRVPDPAYQAAFIKGVPLGKAGEPIDIAETVVFLASDRAKYITGEIITVDGGTLAGRYFLPENPESKRSGKAQ